MVSCRAFLLSLSIIALALSESDRKERFLSVFNIVKFPNDACDAGSKNGTCYTKDECDNLGGTDDGSCANGYGVCCTFTVNCGETSSQNNSYFESSGDESGNCVSKVCPINNNICQIRLDFETFSITGPSTSTVTNTAFLNGATITTAGGGTGASGATNCLTDRFNVISRNGVNPPTICGENSGVHMYLESDPNCVDLAFLLKDTGVGATKKTPSFSIRITQYDCGFENLAPSGCTQYFYGEDTGVLKSFNFDGGIHLSNQRQSICFRREEGKSQICYSADNANDFAISKGKASASATKGSFLVTECCSYGADGKGEDFDCVMIPSASTKSGKILSVTGFCGDAGLGTAKAALAGTTDLKTLCTKRQPFALNFQSDGWETADEGTTKSEGFQLNFEQK